jgi:DNA-directed RNA polymerase subunit L
MKLKSILGLNENKIPTISISKKEWDELTNKGKVIISKLSTGFRHKPSPQTYRLYPTNLKQIDVINPYNKMKNSFNVSVKHEDYGVYLTLTEGLNENKKTFDSFKKEFNNVITHAAAYLKGDEIEIYLDDNPNEEKNIINKLVRTKYSDKLKKVRSEEDVMKFKIVESILENKKSKETSMVLQLMDKDYSYERALKAVLAKYKSIDRKTLEKELDKYI